MREALPYVSERMKSAGLVPMNTEAMDALRARLGLRLKRINGTMISIAVEVPSIVLNRAFGFGLSETATENGIGRICAVYREDDLDSFT